MRKETYLKKHYGAVPKNEKSVTEGEKPKRKKLKEDIPTIAMGHAFKAVLYGGVLIVPLSVWSGAGGHGSFLFSAIWGFIVYQISFWVQTYNLHA